MKAFENAAEGAELHYAGLIATRGDMLGGPTPCQRGWTGCEPAYVSYDAVRQLLWDVQGPDGGTGLLLYHASSPDSVEMFLVSTTVPSNGWEPAHASVGSSELASALESLRVAIEVGPLQRDRLPNALRNVHSIEIDGDVPALAEAVAAASALLFPEPIRKALERVDRLYIVPSAGIGTAPLGMLEPLGDGRPLIEHTTVTVAPSLQDVLDALQWASGRPVRRAFRQPLVVGGVEYGGHLEALPGAKAEAQFVAQMLGTNPVLGIRATVEHVRSEAQESDLLYFATHGLADAVDPLWSAGLYLANGERWSTGDVLNTPLTPAYLTVLSACQTGLGMALEGGVIHLGRAFSLSGSDHVVMSLWNVDDVATAFLMEGFMGQLLVGCNRPEGCDVARALQHAILAARERYPREPSKWAPFVHFGTPAR